MFNKNEQAFTRTELRILRFLADRPAEALFPRELSRKLGISVGSASMLLRKLRERGLLQAEQKGTLRLYRIEHGPAVRQLKLLLMLEDLRPLVEALKPFSKRIVLYGSAAKGEDAAESDIDLFVLARDAERARDAIASARRGLRKKLSPVVLTTEAYARMKRGDPVFYENVNKGVVLWEGHGP